MRACVHACGRARRASGSACHFSEVMNSLSQIGGRFIPTIFTPISRPTAGQSEVSVCYPREHPPGGKGSPVLLAPRPGSRQPERCNVIIKILFLYTRERRELMYCNLLYDVYFEGYDKTYHLAFTMTLKSSATFKYFFNHSVNNRR